LKEHHLATLPGVQKMEKNLQQKFRLRTEKRFFLHQSFFALLDTAKVCHYPPLIRDFSFKIKSKKTFPLKAKQNNMGGFLQSFLSSRVARFFLIKYTKKVKNIPNYHKITQRV
jgi:hypothetical protein